MSEPLRILKTTIEVTAVAVSVVLPCLNEEQGVGKSVRDALEGLRLAGVEGEVIVVDNGSTDGSIQAATSAGARVIRESRRGTGVAMVTGIREARGEIIVTADSDGTYDLINMKDLLVPFNEGADLVIGSRLSGSIASGAMPALHRHLGTPAFNLIMRLLAGSKVSDSQSGYRVFRKSDLLALGIRTPGFESVTELILRATRAGWDIKEVPSNYAVRLGESKLSTWRDGWKHLRMLVVLSPHNALFIPGLFAVLVGLLLAGIPVVAPEGLKIGGLDWNPIFLGPLFAILGGQLMIVGAISAHRNELAPAYLASRLRWLREPAALDLLLRRLATVALLGVAVDALLFGIWVTGHSTYRLVGVAGLAQAMIVIGLTGIATVLATDFATEALYQHRSEDQPVTENG